MNNLIVFKKKKLKKKKKIWKVFGTFSRIGAGSATYAARRVVSGRQVVSVGTSARILGRVNIDLWSRQTQMRTVAVQRLTEIRSPRLPVRMINNHSHRIRQLSTTHTHTHTNNQTIKQSNKQSPHQQPDNHLQLRSQSSIAIVDSLTHWLTDS